MSHEQIAELIDRFVKCVGKWLLRHSLNPGRLRWLRCAEDSPAEVAQLKKINDRHNREMDAMVEVKRETEALAAELDRIGEDSTNVLKLCHFVAGGGGPDNAYLLWPDLKPSLQRIAIRLRNGAGLDADVQPPPPAATAANRQKAKRRRASAWKLRPITGKQTEATLLVAEHNGNVTAAAKAAGKSRQAMQKLYDKANKKLGRKVMEKIAKTQALPTDSRGQATVIDSSTEDENDE